jgi:hypothetical protein
LRRVSSLFLNASIFFLSMMMPRSDFLNVAKIAACDPCQPEQAPASPEPIAGEVEQLS